MKQTLDTELEACKRIKQVQPSLAQKRVFPRQMGALAASLAVLALSGCGTTSTGGVFDQALQTVGLQRPQLQVPENVSAASQSLTPRPVKVVIRLHAGQVLNTDPQGNSLPVVTRIYKLKDKTAFQQAPDAAFLEMKPSKFPDLAADIVDVKEAALTPGQRFETTETVPGEAPFIGVVALFRAPAEQRWRFVFDTKAAAAAGLTLGVHGCALSVASGQALNVAPEMTRLAGVQCQ